MLDDDEVLSTVRDLWASHRDELATHDRVYDYVRGKRGVPEVPDGSGDELEDIAQMSVKNVLSLVRDAFAQNLSVIGFRSPAASEDDPVWALWQHHRLDARQAEAHRAAITYGAAYAVTLTDQVRLRSPRQLFAAYEDPTIDEWPVYALDTWLDTSGRKPVRRGVLYDDEFGYPVLLGNYTGSSRLAVSVIDTEDPVEHGAGVCPVVRFINARDAEDMVVGEVYPLIGQQRAINAVNFDRLVVSRFGAFPQRYVIGWAAKSVDEALKAAMSRVWAFDDESVKAGAFPAASVEPYNTLLEEMLVHVAMTAQIPLSAFGNMANLSADALAMAEAPHQRKLVEKRESFGESWEQVLGLLGRLNGLEVSDAAEVVWRDTEARSFAQVVDGIVKLAQAGVPIDTMLDDVPGWSQQRVKAARDRLGSSQEVVAALNRLASGGTDTGGA